MATNIVCSDSYIDAFSRLDRRTQKKSLETMRLMQRGLKSDGLKVEKLNTKLDFKSARVTQDYRAIFTQSGDTVLLVYIDHHDDAYSWATRRIQGFDVEGAKPAFSYFEKSKNIYDPVTGEYLWKDTEPGHSRSNAAPHYNIRWFSPPILILIALAFLFGMATGTLLSILIPNSV